MPAGGAIVSGGADLPAEPPTCPQCQPLEEAHARHQQVIRTLGTTLPSNAELGAILRQRICSWLATASDDELGEFARLVQEGSLQDVARYGAGSVGRTQN